MEGPIASYRAVCLRFYLDSDAASREAIDFFERCPPPAGVSEANPTEVALAIDDAGADKSYHHPVMLLT